MAVGFQSIFSGMTAFLDPENDSSELKVGELEQQLDCMSSSSTIDPNQLDIRLRSHLRVESMTPGLTE